MFYVTVSIPLGASLTQIAYGPGSLGTLIGNVVGFGITIAAVFTLIWLLLGGIQWITSSGDKAKVEEARDRITQAIVGLAIVMSVWGLWFLITSRFFGLNLTGTGGSSTANTQFSLVGDPNRQFDTGACASQCAREKPGCTGAVDRPEKNEFGIANCECVPPVNYRWAQSGNNPYDHCEPL